MTDQSRADLAAIQESLRVQVAMAMASLAAAFVETLQGLPQDDAPLATLQTKVQVHLAKLERVSGPDVAEAAQILRIVRDALRNPALTPQPED